MNEWLRESLQDQNELFGDVLEEYAQWRMENPEYEVWIDQEEDVDFWDGEPWYRDMVAARSY